METFRFEELVGSKEVFFSEYFNRKPLLRRGAVRDRVRELISIRQLDDVITMETVHPSYVRVAKDGKGIPQKAYTRTVPNRGAALAEAMVPEKVYELFRSGATITWNSVNHFLPSVRLLLDGITGTFACRGEVVAFLTPARRDGYAPHYDPVDVFVVQIEGTKSWRVWDTPEDRKGDQATFGEGELGEPALEVTLHPGDVLYMPYNTPHAAAAQDEVSLHLSVTVEPRRWRDLLRETVDVLVEDPRYDGFPHLDEGLSPHLTRELAAKLEMLWDQLTAVVPEAEARRLAKSGRRLSGTGLPREFERLSLADGLGPGTALRRSAAEVSFTASDGAKTGLLVNGHRIAVPDAVATVLRELETGAPVAASRIFPGAPEDRSLRAAQGLARLGVLEAADSTRS